MGWSKKYTNHKPIKRARCIDNSNCDMIYDKVVYDIIKQTETQYLVQFKSKGAHWYDRNRFQDIDLALGIKQLTPKKENINTNTKQLF